MSVIFIHSGQDIERERQTDRDREKQRQRDRETETHRERNRQTDRPTETERYLHVHLLFRTSKESTAKWLEWVLVGGLIIYKPRTVMSRDYIHGAKKQNKKTKLE